MGLQTFDALKGIANSAADAVVNFKSTALAGGQHIASMVGSDMQLLRNSAKAQALGAIEHGKQVASDIGQHSINDAVASGKKAIENGYGYVTGTPLNQIGADAANAVKNDIAYKVASQKLGQARNYGKTLLSDIDQFYHNADGSYNRTKVGATAAAGLGIAGIAGYNMNN